MTLRGSSRPQADQSSRVRVGDLGNLADRLYGLIEQIIGWLVVAVLGFGAVVIAVWLTGPVLSAIRSIPKLLKGSWRIAQVAWSLPWENWIVFPVVLTLVLAALWYSIQRELRNDERPSRGRTILSGDELRRSASRLNRPDSRPPKPRRPS